MPKKDNLIVGLDIGTTKVCAVVGEVTSGTFSPSLGKGIGLALLDPAIAENDGVVVDIRGRQAPFTVVRPPFVEPHVR